MPNLGTQFSPPAYNTQQVIWGVGYLFTATFGTALPADKDLGDNTMWSSWTYVGSTDQGVQNAFTPNMTQIQIEETPIPVASLVNTATFQITFTMSEETLNHIKLAYGGGGSITSTAAGIGQPATQRLTLSTNFATLACAILGANQLGYPRVYYVPKIMSAGTVTTTFRRAANARTYPVTLNALCDLSQIVIIDITGAATG